MKNKLLILLLSFCFTNLYPQNNSTKFGIQYKPIIPSKYFNSSYITKESVDYIITLKPRYSSSLGMVLRHKMNKTFSLESGLNYAQRNYSLEINNNNIGLDDFSIFPIRSYEIPIQILTYVRVYELLYLNVSFGLSHNIIASDVFSSGNKTEEYFQNTYRKNGGYRALLANIGVEYRNQQNGFYYFGATLHRPWDEIARIYPEYANTDNTFNHDLNFNEKIFLEIIGTFLTLDFRYFFAK